MSAPASRTVYSFSLYVPYAHTDQMGVVYYANYLVYFEMARGAMLREAGLPYGEMERQGLALPVVEAHCVYRQSAHYDDEICVASRCSLSGARLRIDHRIQRDSVLLAEGYTLHACVGRDGKVVRPPAALRRLAGATG